MTFPFFDGCPAVRVALPLGRVRMTDAPLRLAASRPLYCRVIDIVDVRPDTRIVRLSIVHGGAFQFRVGQYARLTFGGSPPIDGVMANRPQDPVLEFHLRHQDDQGQRLYAARELRVGDGVWVEGPYGDG